MIISTPGHPSPLVKLPKTGAVLLTGNWDHRRVPSQNADKDNTLGSMNRIADLPERYKAQLWISHDKPQRDTQKTSPQFHD